MYSTCIQCFNKKVRCEFCNKELNKRYLRSHVKKQHLYQHYNRDSYRAASQDDKREASHKTAQLRDSSRKSYRDSSHTNINTGGDLLPVQVPTHNNNNDDDNNKCNRTLIVGQFILW